MDILSEVVKMLENEEEKLKRKLAELERKREEESREKHHKDILMLFERLPSPVAKAKLFGKSIGLIPHDVPTKNLREIVEGYTALGMYREAGRIEESRMENYERAIELYLRGIVETPDDKQRACLRAEAARVTKYKQGNEETADDKQRAYLTVEAARVAKDKQGNQKRAINIMIEYARDFDVVKFISSECNDLGLALKVAEERGLFSEAFDLARRMGDKDKMEFYEITMRIARTVIQY